MVIWRISHFLFQYMYVLFKLKDINLSYLFLQVDSLTETKQKFEKTKTQLDIY